MLIVHTSSSLVNCDDVPDPGDSEFKLFTYCKSMCQWGRGGNLCNCRAAYFAGKRGVDWVRGATASSMGVGQPSTEDDNGDMWTAMAVDDRQLTKLLSTAAGRDGDSDATNDDVERRWWTATGELRRHLRSSTSSSRNRWQ